MTVKQAIEQLQKLPQDAELMCPDMAVGGSVDVVGFERVSETWIDVAIEQDEAAKNLE